MAKVSYGEKHDQVIWLSVHEFAQKYQKVLVLQYKIFHALSKFIKKYF